MNVRRLVIPACVPGGALLLVVAFAILQLAAPARALPPAGTDNVSVSADVSITSRLGSETVHLTGTASIQRQDPHMDGAVEVVDDALTAINLTGQSLTGAVTITQSPSQASIGEIRSQQPPPDQFPASSFFDVFVGAVVPASGSGSVPPFHMHTEDPLHLAPASNVTSWPPYGVEFRSEPDPCIHMLRDVPDPRNPDPWLPAQICVTKVAIVMALPPTPTATATPCVPTCTPTPTMTPTVPTPTRTPRATSTPTRPPTPTPPPGPEDPTFSVAPGGPSGLPSASLLALGVGAPTVSVSGNDDFANAWPIGTLLFAGHQNTTGTTTQAGEPLIAPPSPLPPDYCISVEPNAKGSTVWYRFTPVGAGTVTVDTTGSDFDTVLAAYAGSALNALTQVGCDDDNGSGLQSLISFPVTGGTTYHIQAGGFAYAGGAAVGELRLHVSTSGAAGTVSAHVAITCLHLGLTAEGCAGVPGAQDSIDGLSAGQDFVTGSQPIFFSVGPGSVGLPGSGVAQQAACTQPEPQADEFASSRNGTNYLFLDGDGRGTSCPTASTLGLIEQPTSDQLTGLTGEPASAIDTNGDGLPDHPVFFSLAPGSPTLTALARGPADILWTVGGFQPGVYASSAQLGLQSGDDIDGLCIADRGDSTVYESNLDTVYFSLAPGSPSLATIGASPADVLRPGPQVAMPAAELGLRPTDNLGDMKCFSSSGQTTTVAVGDIWYCNPSEAGHACDTIIRVGDTVQWDFSGATIPHSTTDCGGANCASPVPKSQALWNSGVISPSSPVRTFSYTFTTTGFFYYYCQVHGTGHLGRIIVVGIPNTPTPTATRTATPTPTRHTGDANKDGAVNAIDAALILQFGAGFLQSINSSADANHDGRTDAIDAALVLQYVAGFLPDLP